MSGFLLHTWTTAKAWSYLFNRQTGSWRVNARTENLRSENKMQNIFMEQTSVTNAVTLFPLPGQSKLKGI